MPSGSSLVPREPYARLLKGLQPPTLLQQIITALLKGKLRREALLCQVLPAFELSLAGGNAFTLGGNLLFQVREFSAYGLQIGVGLFAKLVGEQTLLVFFLTQTVNPCSKEAFQCRTCGKRRAVGLAQLFFCIQDKQNLTRLDFLPFLDMLFDHHAGHRRGHLDKARIRNQQPQHLCTFGVLPGKQERQYQAGTN